MKESNRKEPAIHPGPESCGGIREGAHEALTGGSTGEVLSHEIHISGLPPLLSEAEGETGDRDKASDPRNRRGRRPSARVDVSCAGTGRSRSSPEENGSPERAAKVQSRNAAMHGCGKSEKAVVPEKPSNEGPLLTAGPEETVEGRAFAKRNSRPQSTSRTKSRNHDVSPEWERVRQRAKRKTNWVLDADIRGFFDTIDHGWLKKFLQHRIGDRRVLRLIDKWLDAGVMENGNWRATERGTPQGANISPLLANIYLHYVFDLWAQQWRKRHARGEMIVVRYADDFVTGFEFQDDAVRFLAALKERLGKFALELHGDKTRLIEFGWYAGERLEKRGQGKPETFTFLGFVHICDKTKQGWFRPLRRTESKRQVAKLKELGEEMKIRRHESIKVQGAWLGAVLRGYYGYYAVPGNSKSMQHFQRELTRRWYRSLCRRSHKRRLNWSKMQLHVSRWLPRPLICHPYPEQRFKERHHSR